MNAAAIKSIVTQQLMGNVSIASTSDFLQAVLRLSPKAGESFNEIYKQVKEKFWTGGKSRRGGRWRSFPTKAKANLCESDYYTPFVDLANGVSDHCKALKLIDNESVEGYWVSRPHQAPKTRDLDHPMIKPDIVHVTKPQAFRALDKKLSNVQVREDGNLEKEKRNMSRVWWLQVHTVVEVKVAATPHLEDLNGAVIQLCSYMRQMFGEQLDRRFVIGMLLCGDNLTLWLCDRSGLVGTLEPIRIHQDPEMFIKVLVAFATLPAKKLGWDPTMRVYQSPSRGRNREPIPSYKMAPTDKDFQTDSYQVNWVISVPTKGDSNHREDFVTLRAAIAASTYDLCTRGTIVWQVVKLKDFKAENANKKIYILKQIWRPLRTDELDRGKWTKDPDQKPFEAEMYDAAGMGDRVYSSEDLDESCTLKVRDGLNAESLHEATEWNERFQTLMLRSRSAQERTESQEPFTYLNCTESPDYGIFYHLDDHVPACRVQARLLLEEWGFPLKYFLNLRELLGAIRGAVKDHEKMYFAGVLHRDVSIGNILIAPNIATDNVNDGSESQDCGKLIDLDHAKRAISLSPYIKHDPPPNDALTEILNQLRRSIDRGVVAHACVRYGNSYLPLMKYLEELYDFEYGQNATETLTMERLGWITHDKWCLSERPQFSDEKSKNPPRTGTIQFMSAEVMLSKNISQSFRTEHFTHNVIHDMESFFWVLVYICLTRNGPGGKRRTELTSPKPGGRSALYNTIQKVFENVNLSDLALQRQNLVMDLLLFKQDILNHFHPYFGPLEPMMEKWYTLLQRARHHHSIEYDHIHIHVEAILDEAIMNLQPDDPSYADGTITASQAREKWWHESPISVAHPNVSPMAPLPTRTMESPTTPTPTAGPSTANWQERNVKDRSPLSPSHTLNSRVSHPQNARTSPRSPLHRMAYRTSRKRKLQDELSSVQARENLASPKKRLRSTKAHDEVTTNAEAPNRRRPAATSSSGGVGSSMRVTRSSSRIAQKNANVAESTLIAPRAAKGRKKAR
ncbi:hypothetical protein F5887DRAFT_236522 [Amanita rubescens]|nr:hypothetical protein F5887DRAFT_236522 [Amanita rubescens]